MKLKQANINSLTHTHTHTPGAN